MKRPVPALVAALSVLALLVAAAGCAAGKAAERAPGPPPRVELRIPGIDSPEVDIEKGKEETGEGERAPPQPELRLSPAEEARGRWLRIFDVDVHPSAEAETAEPPPMPDGP